MGWSPHGRRGAGRARTRPDPGRRAEYWVFGFPETCFIDADGVIRAKHAGPIDAQTLDTYVASILD